MRISRCHLRDGRCMCLVITAEGCHDVLHSAPPLQESARHVDEQVQAHVAQTEVDPGAAVAWLRVTDAGMEASPTATQLIRFTPSPHCPGLLPASLFCPSLSFQGGLLAFVTLPVTAS